MLIPTGVRIHLCVEAVSLLRGIDGLAACVENVLLEDPLSGHVFVFHNRSRSSVKLLLWDQGGYVLIHKRLERGRFRIPCATGAKITMTSAELAALLEGIDISHAPRLSRWNPTETRLRV